MSLVITYLVLICTSKLAAEYNRGRVQRVIFNLEFNMEEERVCK